MKRKVPFLFLTGYNDLAIIPSAFHGIKRLSKPFRFEELTSAAAAAFAPGKLDEPA